MPGLVFSKLVPGGNTTILLEDSSLPQEELSMISARLMHPLHLQAEQVGALHYGGSIPHLQMMGGEFCVNATRSAALLLARSGRLLSAGDSGCFYGRITVSGMTSPVNLLAAKDASLLNALLAKITEGEAPVAELFPDVASGEGAFENSPPPHPLASETRLFCAARVHCGAGSTRSIPLGDGVCLVHLPGISHLLVDIARHPMPPQWRNAAADWRIRSGLGNAPASGVVWYEMQDDDCRIWPAVEVKATASEHLETACGSASMAMALMLRAKDAALRGSFAQEKEPGLSLPASALKSSIRTTPLMVTQPSGEALAVSLQYRNSPHAQNSSEPEYAWISGPVFLAAEGTAYI